MKREPPPQPLLSNFQAARRVCPDTLEWKQAWWMLAAYSGVNTGDNFTQHFTRPCVHSCSPAPDVTSHQKILKLLCYGCLIRAHLPNRWLVVSIDSTNLNFESEITGLRHMFCFVVFWMDLHSKVKSTFVLCCCFNCYLANPKWWMCPALASQGDSVPAGDDGPFADTVTLEQKISSIGGSSGKVSLWMQWMLPKVTVKLFSPDTTAKKTGTESLVLYSLPLCNLQIKCIYLYLFLHFDKFTVSKKVIQNPLHFKQRKESSLSVLQHQLLRDKFLTLFSFKHCALGEEGSWREWGEDDDGKRQINKSVMNPQRTTSWAV